MTLGDHAAVGKISDLKDTCGLGTCKTTRGCVPCAERDAETSSQWGGQSRLTGQSSWNNSSVLKQDGLAEVSFENSEEGSKSAGWQLNP